MKRCEQQEVTAIKPSNESLLNCMKNYQKNPIFFLFIYAVFGADNQFDDSCMGKKTANNFEKNPINNGFLEVSA